MIYFVFTVCFMNTLTCVRNITPVIRDAQLAYPEDYVNGWCITEIKSNSI